MVFGKLRVCEWRHSSDSYPLICDQAGNKTTLWLPPVMLLGTAEWWSLFPNKYGGNCLNRPSDVTDIPIHCRIVMSSTVPFRPGFCVRCVISLRDTFKSTGRTAAYA